MKRRAFTLAEIMIVLTVMGALAAILLPIMNKNRPDEGVIKFHKANETIANVVSELVSSNQYCAGDLGLKNDCKTTITNYNEFCSAFAELVKTKKVNCKSTAVGPFNNGMVFLSNESAWGHLNPSCAQTPIVSTVNTETIAATKIAMDTGCKGSAKNVGKEIVTADDIVYYDGSTNVQFGFSGLYNGVSFRHFSSPNQSYKCYKDQNGFDIAYKVFCVDVDGFDESKGSDDCDDINDICPFGYGIRVDGKILPGARADEWIEKEIQKSDND